MTPMRAFWFYCMGITTFIAALGVAVAPPEYGPYMICMAAVCGVITMIILRGGAK